LQPGTHHHRTRRRRTHQRKPDQGGIRIGSGVEGNEHRMATNSIKSNALEPTRAELINLPLAARVFRTLPAYGLVILTVLLALFFSILLPETFPTVLNARSIIS